MVPSNTSISEVLVLSLLDLLLNLISQRGYVHIFFFPLSTAKVNYTE